MIVEENFRTGVKDIDKNFEISNKSILEIFENIGGYHSDIIGYGVLDIPNTNRSWVLLEWQLQVIKRPKYGEKLKAKTWARKCSKFFTHRDFEIYNEKNEKCIIGTSKWTWVDCVTGKMAKIDSNIDVKYGAEEKHVFPEEEIEKIEEPMEYINIKTYTVAKRDIDINNHMHNIYYLDLAEEALPEDVYNLKPYNNLRITYKRGIKLGETVSIKYGKIDEKHIIRIENEEGKESAVVAMWN